MCCRPSFDPQPEFNPDHLSGLGNYERKLAPSYKPRLIRRFSNALLCSFTTGNNASQTDLLHGFKATCAWPRCMCNLQGRGRVAFDFGRTKTNSTQPDEGRAIGFLRDS
jgi:hypothetical protein